MWRIDFYYLPELVPGAKNVENVHSISGLWEETTRKVNHIFMLPILFMGCIIWYVPAMIWRWGLKSTWFLWWSTALLLFPPFYGKNSLEIWESTAMRVRVFLSISVLAIYIFFFFWLLSHYFPSQVQWALTLLSSLPYLDFIALYSYSYHLPIESIRYWMIWAVLVTVSVVWILAFRLNTFHQEILAKHPKTMPDRFRKRAEWLQRIYTLQIFLTIMLSLSIIGWWKPELFPPSIPW